MPAMPNAAGPPFPLQMHAYVQGSKTMYMHVGSRRDKPGTAAGSAATLPLPTDPAVSLGVSGGELVAVLQFDGFITPQTAGTARAQLKSALARGRGRRVAWGMTWTLACCSPHPRT